MPDGTPAYSITAKNGNARATTLRDARQLGLVPSVTTIIRCASKPALENWKIDQALMAALTLPKQDGETLEAFMARAKADSKEQARKAAERGTALHGAIERYLQGEMPETEWAIHISNVRKALSDIGIDLHAGKAERSFASSLGYGGKVDWHDPLTVIDFKSKDWISEKTQAYDEQGLQLSAYGEGLKLPGARRLNVFIGVNDAKVKIHEWPVDSHNRHWNLFRCLLEYWQLSNNFVWKSAA